MAFNWKGAEQSSGGNTMPDGLHKAKISEIRPAKNRNDQIIVTFSDVTGTMDAFYTLTDKAAWTMAKLLSRAGNDLESLERDGIEPRHLAKQEVADQYLLGATVWLKVYTLSKDNPKNLDKNGVPYRRAEPLHAAEADAADPVEFSRINGTSEFDASVPF